MRFHKFLIRRLMSGGMVLLLCATPEMAVAFTGQEGGATGEMRASGSEASRPQSSSPSPDTPVPAQPEELPDSPGTVRTQLINLAQSQQPTPETPETPTQETAPQPPQQTPPQPAQPAPPQKPVGTAVAEIGNASGIAASKPAGVAVAPAKQRQSRSLFIKIGALVGAGAAIGTVVALTGATSSKPPGAH